MNKILCSLLVAGLSIFGAGAHTLPFSSAGNNPELPKSLLKPDFAYPKNVMSVAETFMSASSADNPDNVLAVSEWVKADYSIDRQRLPQSIVKVMKMADKASSDPATRAMLLCYAARLCEKASETLGFGNNRSYSSDPTLWNNTEFGQASDSLYVLAYKTAPADASVAPYKNALTASDAALGLAPTIRDFILMMGHSGNEILQKKIKDLPAVSPLRMYFEAMDINYKNELVDYIDKLFDVPGSEYAFFVYMLNYASSGDIDRTENYRLFTKAKSVYKAKWISDLIDRKLKQISEPKWNLSIDKSNAVPGDTLHFTLVSSNTDSLVFEIRRFNDFRQADKYYSGYAATKRIKFVPHSSLAADTTHNELVLNAGTYVIRLVYPHIKYSNNFRSLADVCPWSAFMIKSNSGNTLQVLDSRSGKPVQGIKVSYKGSSAGMKTNADGLVKIPVTKRVNNIILTDPKTGLCFDSDLSTQTGRNKFGVTQGSHLTDVSIVFDRPVYRPGETARWTLTATNGHRTLSGKTFDIKVTLPSPGEDFDDSDKADTTMTTVATDVYGRVSGSYRIPGDAKIGRAYFNTDYGSSSFNISDFKLSDLNLKDIKALTVGDSVIVKGLVTNSAGVGRSDIPVTLNFASGDSIYTRTAVTVANGTFAFTASRCVQPVKVRTVNTVFGPLSQPDDSESMFGNVSLGAASPDGTSDSGFLTYNLFYNANVSIDVPNEVNVLKGMSFKTVVSDFRTGLPADSVGIRWAICNPGDSVAILSGNAVSGTVNLSPDLLSYLKAGSYVLCTIADIEPCQIGRAYFTAYNHDAKDIPDKNALWIPDGAQFDAATGKATLCVGAKFDETILWWCEPGDNGPLSTRITSRMLDKGFTDVVVTVPDSLRGQSAVPIIVWTSRNGMKTRLEYSLTRKESSVDSLSLTCESFRDRVAPGSREVWRFVTRLDNRPVAAAVYVNIYDRQLRQFGFVQMPRLRTARSFVSWYNVKPEWIRPFRNYSDNIMSIRPSSFVISRKLILPDWKYGLTDNRRIMVRGYGVEYAVEEEVMADHEEAAFTGFATADYAAPMARSANKNKMYGARAPQASMKLAGIDGGEASAETEDALDNQPLRTGTVYNAAWAPMLTTDAATGAVDLDFVVPGQNSTWVLDAVAWTSDLKTASVSRTFVAAKPVIVAPNPPRFVRVGDTVNLVSAITNNTDSTQNVSYSVSLAGRDVTGSVTLEAGRTRYVNTPVSITGDVALLDSLDLTVRATNGRYGDGERVAVPILPSSALVVESRTFYLNPADSVYTADVPHPAGSETELHFTANPMWLVVESLPSVIDEPCFEVAPAYARVLYVAKTALLIAREHPVTKAVIDVDKAKASAKDALKALNDLRGEGGGFKWGKWQSEPSLYTTLNILEWMDQDTDDPDVRKLIKGALEYVDNQVARLPGKPSPWLYYAYVRSAYGKPSTLAGRQIIDLTVNDIRKNWRKLGLSDKALAVTLLHRTGNDATARQILESLSQFGEITPDRGMTFPNMPGIVAYANLLEAYGSVSPKAPETDAVRQYLVAQRRGASWGSSAWTSYAVRAMVNTGTDWAVPARPFIVTVDGAKVVPDSVAALSGAVSIPVTGSAVAIDRVPGTPAYGALVTRRVAPLSDIKAFSDGSVSVTKALYRIDSKGNRVPMAADMPKPGEKVIVSLTLTARDDMTDLIITDLRPAAFEPVQQLGRYSRQGSGLWFYLANRDSRTDIYLDRLPRGTYTIDYEVTVNNTGTFTTGMTTVTSTIDPDLTAHSGSQPFTLPE